MDVILSNHFVPASVPVLEWMKADMGTQRPSPDTGSPQ
jgi:hypothetical protein